MRRFIPFVIIFGISIYLALHLAERMGITLDMLSFGFGLGVAALTGFLQVILGGWWSSATRPYRPQTVSTNTQETPNQVTVAALWALVKLVFLVLAIVALVAAVGLDMI